MKSSKSKHRQQQVAPGARVGPATRTEVLGSASPDPALAHNVDPKWARHYRLLVALRARLMDDRAEELAEVAERLEPHGMSQADSATDEFDHDMLLAEVSADQEKLFEVEEALRRIENGTYGICELTGQPIPRERLRAVPWTRFTEKAEERLEQNQAISGAHLGDLHSVRPMGPSAPGSAKTDLDRKEPSSDDFSGILRNTTEALAVEEELEPGESREGPELT